MPAVKKNVWVGSLQDSNVTSQSWMSTFLQSQDCLPLQKLSRCGWQAYRASIALGVKVAECFLPEFSLVDRIFLGKMDPSYRCQEISQKSGFRCHTVSRVGVGCVPLALAVTAETRPDVGGCRLLTRFCYPPATRRAKLSRLFQYNRGCASVLITKPNDADRTEHSAIHYGSLHVCSFPLYVHTMHALLNALTHILALISMSAFSCSGSGPVKSMPVRFHTRATCCSARFSVHRPPRPLCIRRRLVQSSIHWKPVQT